MADVEPAGFAAFWEIYPPIRRRDRKKCLDKWIKKNLEEQAERIIADVNERKRSDSDWLKGYVPMPVTYINNERWDDGGRKYPTGLIQEDDDTILYRLWDRLSQLYGKAFTDSYGVEPNNVWRECLHGLTLRDYRNGWSRLMAEKPGRPPNAMQFLFLCRTGPRNVHKPLPRPKVDKEAAKIHLQKMREALGGGHLRGQESGSASEPSGGVHPGPDTSGRGLDSGSKGD